MGAVKLLDHGYLRFVEAWGHGDAGGPRLEVDEEGFQRRSISPEDCECGIVEAARQSTQGSFRGWEDRTCQDCGGSGDGPMAKTSTHLPLSRVQCPTCDGRGYIPGDARLLAYLDSHKHTTPFEFSGMTIEVQAPIMVFREWHRHRTQSYNEMSARYEPLPDLNYVPTVDRLLMGGGHLTKQAGAVKGAPVLTELDAIQERLDLIEDYQRDEESYQRALKRGVPKELARLRLPVGRYSRMRATANLLNWLRFLTLRMAPDAQYEIRQYANTVGNLIAEHFPRTWKLFDSRRAKTP